MIERDATFRLTCPGCGEPRALRAPGATGDGSVHAAPLPACAGCGAEQSHEDGVLILDAEPGVGEWPGEVVARVAEVEEQHWWHASRNRVLGTVLRRAARERTLETLVELGCGTGFVLRHFEQWGLQVAGLDMDRAALAVARRRVGGPLIRSGRLAIPLADPVDVVAVIDVLEHNPEVPLLAACRDALRPGGLLLLSVPAQPWLWSLEDVMSGHQRRYTRRTLKAAVEASGFRMLRQVPFHLAVTPLAWRAAHRPLPDPLPTPAEYFGTTLRAPSSRGHALATAALRLEAAIGSVVPLPFASHLAALAERT